MSSCSAAPGTLIETSLKTNDSSIVSLFYRNHVRSNEDTVQSYPRVRHFEDPSNKCLRSRAASASVGPDRNLRAGGPMMSSSNEDGTAQQASPADGSDAGPGARPKGRPGRKPKGTVPAVVTELPERPDPGHVLTWRQRKVLQVIRESVQRRGYPPSMREIGEAVGLTSTSSVSYQLSTLQSKGYLRRDAGRPRTVEVRLPGHPAVRPEPGNEDEAADEHRLAGGGLRTAGRPDRGRAARSSPRSRSRSTSRCPGRLSARERCSCSRSSATR